MKRKTLVGSYKNLEVSELCLLQQIAVLQTGPALLLNRPYLVAYKVRRQLAGQLLIEQNAHDHSMRHGPLRARRRPARAIPKERRREILRDDT
ncbi:MAG: hypothetical protein ABJC89_26350, partial [Acidobacteriota bacterium]